MRVVDYIRKKNALVFKATGLVLVPEEQIVEVEKWKLKVGSDATICPYCMVYFRDDCKGCPMFEAGNKCIDDCHNTYSTVISKLKYTLELHYIATVPGMVELVERFNKELE